MGLLKTGKPHRKSPKTAKPQEVSFKTKSEIKALTDKTLSDSLQNLFSRLNLFYFPKFFSDYFLVRAEIVVIKEFAYYFC